MNVDSTSWGYPPISNRESTGNTAVRSAELCPNLFDDHRPNFILERFGEHRLVVLFVDGEPVINQHLLSDTSHCYSCQEHPARIDLAVGED